MYQFKLHSAETVSQAIELFNGSGDAVYIAGGHTLIPAMKQRLNAPEDLIDLAKIVGIDSIAFEGETLTVGAMATHAATAACLYKSLSAEHCSNSRIARSLSAKETV